jgi:O-antigen/teichoic acid export membrane protein
LENKISKKQVIFFTLINYLGIVIGVVSTLFIYPKNKEVLGIYRYVEALAHVFFTFILFGASQSIVNFSPKLNQKGRRELLGFGMFVILCISIFILCLLYLGTFFPALQRMKYVFYALPIGLFMAYVELFKKQSTVIQKLAIPSFFDTIIPKLALPLLFLCLLGDALMLHQSLLVYVLAYGLIALFTGVYVFNYIKPSFATSYSNLFSSLTLKEYLRFSLFAFSGSLGAVFAFKIDTLMIPKFISMQANGTFSIGVTLASALAIPATGIFSLYAPIISGYLKENNLADLNRKYQEISKLLLFIGALFYSCIFLGINDLFSLLPTHDNLVASIPVILILGASVLVNMGTGFNTEIIIYSKYYRFNLIAIVSLALMNVALNLFFLQYLKLGIEAVAFASLISMVVFNAAKLVFIYKKLGLFPFDIAYLKLTFIFCSSLIFIWFLPNLDTHFFNLLYKVGLSLIINLVLVYKLKLVFTVTSWVDKFMKK